MKKIIKSSICLFVVAVLSSCESKQKEAVKTYTEAEVTEHSKRLNDWFHEQFQQDLKNSPQMQTSIGDKTDYGKWDDISAAAEATQLQIAKDRLQWLHDTIDEAALDASTALSLKLYKQKLTNHIDDYQHRLYYYPLNQMHGMQAEIPAFLINMHQIKNKSDAEAYISRLNGLKIVFAQVEEILKEQEKAGIMPPKFVFTHVINDCENIIKGKPFDNSDKNNTLWNDFTTKISNIALEKGEHEKLKEAAKEALVNSVAPAYTSLISLLKAQKARATTEDGVWKFPNGNEFYNIALQRTTTTDMTADEIHELGLQEVARIHDEMKKIKEQVGFKGTLQEFFVFMKNDAQFYYPATTEGRKAYMDKATAIIDSMKSRLDELFITKPKADIQVKAVEAFREKSAGKAFYKQPAIDGSRPGTYYANMYRMEAMPSYQMEALAYHEGIPGHHMQIAIAQELENVPMFRKLGGYTAYVEGWGLYSELIPKEMGFYSDPYSDFGRLAMELWRACRLVVDTGIHTKKWTREQGIEYYTSNTPNAESDAIKMVERHIVMPSQATAYKVGMNKIVDLHKNAKKELGEKFDVREFHEVVLSNGAVPLNVLSDLVDTWIASKK
ncbi:uncharacterized protein (DUF885 family) [Kordia periserrulae]|uniref:Uncharacterized protein (DUF885 family) n=1 Tax=Kordia periserrulae TaxID=701523 RepID=A0A2T6C4A0_9FLAO|nr:DUF885 domain-containing protein [Kordia periserrulae]PTX63113.1 uncharacterized protein (DUF885 family) [Kordia periserrulae]